MKWSDRFGRRVRGVIDSIDSGLTAFAVPIHRWCHWDVPLHGHSGLGRDSDTESSGW